ncbi:DNA repair protein RecO [Gleimia coleocanis DSM 15436]|uniref:DNA repair protein RecO n=1 Tax=Gleimia coleocanis DSM 15436 TaxID=525245 RepID=C0W0A5_9ACTO|nr:DNA repair protein RecO [Gleimia coleocanis]EEH63964.1 DNA repair protein RecO [Gleimia coleocanis DSM 15436]
MSKTYRDEGIVLRTHKLGEADRIITLLTHHHGVKRVVAKGVRRTTSKFGSRLEPFTVVDAQIHIGRSLDVLNQVESIRQYGLQIAQDYDKYMRASVLVETAERLSEDDASPQMYLLLLGALHALATGRYPADLVMNSFLLRAMALSGWAPSFWDCALCGANGPSQYFHLQSGGAVCLECRPPGSAAPSAEAMRLLGELLSGDWEAALTSEDFARREAGSLVAAWVQWNVERRIVSFTSLKSGIG